MPRKESVSVKKHTLKKKAVAKVKKATLKVQEMELPLHMLLPNLATIVALCMGLSAIRFSFQGRMHAAVLALLAAAFFDAVDGRLARLLKAESEFGAQFDSLSDFAAFGVAPAVILYISTLHALPKWGWTFCLFFSVCQAIRLARFNAHLQQAKRKLPANFFVGVPAPMGALIALYPTFIEFVTHSQLHPIVHMIGLLVAGCFTVSRIPTYSLKSIHITQGMRRPVLIGAGFTIAAVINATWPTLLFATTLYLISIPFSWIQFRSMRHSQKWPKFS
ncbi:phosphatidylcholine/phosphatidylserine synthase [Alphaproteobacteria bacterium]|nr:phosphatidylcholine/phosphatidylserine synthase [Alphaproteobacteria bacterium]